MRWWRSEVEWVYPVRVDFVGGRICRPRCFWFAILASLTLVCLTGLVDAGEAIAESCSNAALRVGPSASLPDCRAYELVTPADLGRTQALTFTGGDVAIVSSDGEKVALQTLVPFGPDPSLVGARAVFSRTATGWEMGSAVAPGAGGQAITMRLFDPELSLVGFESETALNEIEKSKEMAFEVGPVGGPYALVASVPREDVEAYTRFLGASADFGDVLFASIDHELPLPEIESAAAKATDSGALNLYDWSGGNLHLVNVRENGLPLANLCGAVLGAPGGDEESKPSVHAVSEDGSKIFFTIPGETHTASGPGCSEPARLYMRVDDAEPVEVSAPEPGVVPAETLPVRYNYATADGSKVFFNTETALTSNDVSKANNLFEYDTEAPEGKRLRLVASGVPTTVGVGLEERKGFFFSEDGSAVYIDDPPDGEVQDIERYDTSTGERTLVAVSHLPHGTRTPSFSTPNGEFFLFPSRGVEGEPRGAGHEELYRYDNANRSVMCVTCGGSEAPEQGEVIEVGFGKVLETEDETPALTQISEDGQEVFFQTTAQLVPQDTNSTETEFANAKGTPGLDVYEWEAEGVEEAPDVFCENPVGCTHILSSGEDVGPARLLGSAASGRDVFFESASQLAPQATAEFPNIYDARVDGGFAPRSPAIACLSCQGVGSPPPLFNIPASGSFVGPGNQVAVEEKPQHPKKKVKSKPKAKRGKKRRRMRSKAAGRGSERGHASVGGRS